MVCHLIEGMRDLIPISSRILKRANWLTVLPMKPCEDRLWMRVESRPLKSTVKLTSVLLPPDKASLIALPRKRRTLALVELQSFHGIRRLRTWLDDTRKKRRHLVPWPPSANYAHGKFGRRGSSKLALHWCGDVVMD